MKVGRIIHNILTFSLFFLFSAPIPIPAHYSSPRLTEGLVVVQLLSHVQLFATPWTAACQASLSFTISWSLLKLMSTESVMSSNYLILRRPLLLLPSIFPSIRVFSNELAFCIWCPKCWMGLLVSMSLPWSCGQMSKFSRPCALEFRPRAHWCLGKILMWKPGKAQNM